jgi:hypothetical protein
VVVVGNRFNGFPQDGEANLMRYGTDQEEHHRRRTFSDEFKILVEKYGLRWHDEENR